MSASKSPRMPMIYEEIDVDEHEKEASDDLFEKSMQGFSNVKIVRNAMMRQMYEKKRELLDKNYAAVIIQGCFRRFMCQLRMNQAIQRSAATDSQKNWRCYKNRKEFLRMKRSAICLQSYTRMWIARKKYNQLLWQRKNAATILQKYLRRHLAIKELKNLREINQAIRNNAATNIQKYWRCYKNRKEFLIIRF